ncbi:MAG: large subunit ribosomal protein L3 [Candidatus Binatia bacterium]|jgi:large subunit ribosomal protein L3
MIGLIGKKIGMTQRFSSEGQARPVTVIETGPCTVVQVRSKERDGYDAIQLGFGTRRATRITKAAAGHMKAAGREDFESLVEFRLDEPGDWTVGQVVHTADLFAAGDKVDVTGTSKGRGFAGVVKRYHFAGQTQTHGSHESFRGPGSVGACAYPGRVFKGKKMPGRMGGWRETTQNLQVVEVLAEQNLVLVCGAVPGGKNGQVLVSHAVKAAGQVHIKAPIGSSDSAVVNDGAEA